MSLRSKIGAGLLALSPMVTLAAGGAWDGTYFTNITTTFDSVVSALVPIFIGLILLAFFYGLFLYINSFI